MIIQDMVNPLERLILSSFLFSITLINKIFEMSLDSLTFNIYWHFSLSLQPSEQNTYADIEAAYKCLVETYGTKPENIILYGQSVGSGPTLDLAARLTCARAVILQSPLLSGLRVMFPVKRTYWFDIYKVYLICYPTPPSPQENERKKKEINCPQNSSDIQSTLPPLT